MNQTNELHLPQRARAWQWTNGVLFCFVIASLGYAMFYIPGLSMIGQMGCALIIAIGYRQFIGYPRLLHSGIQFASKTLLRFSIVLYGLRLNVDIVLNEGLGLLIQDAAVIVLVISSMLFIGKKLNAETSLSTLLAIGTAICGAAAIAAVSPILKSKEENTALSIAMIAIIGSIFAIGYSILRPFLSIEPIHYGMWSGMSLHELAHVVLAAAPAGQEALSIALLAKMGRVLFLAPICFMLLFWTQKGKTNQKTKVPFPWFLVGFLLASFLGSYGFGPIAPITETLVQKSAHWATFMLTMAMAGLGLNVNLSDARKRAVRPMIALILSSLLLSFVSYFIYGFVK